MWKLSTPNSQNKNTNEEKVDGKNRTGQVYFEREKILILKSSVKHL